MVGQCIAVPTNLGTLVAFHHYVSDLWLRTLRRRSQKDRKAWTDMTKLVAQWLTRPYGDPYQPELADGPLSLRMARRVSA